MSLTPVAHAFGFARTASDPSEDAYAIDTPAGVFALADGASSAWRAGDWAAALAAAWVAKPPARGRDRGRKAFTGWLAALREDLTAEDTADPEGPWFTAAAAQRGAHAALLGLTLHALDGKRPRWRTLAVGDVCCFHVRAGALVTATPIDRADQFGAHPDLLSSLPGADVPEPVAAEGDLRAGDMLLLASDALAAFLLRLDTQGAAIWTVMAHLDTGAFRELVRAGSAARLLDRDDTTLLRIMLHGSAEGGGGQ